MPLSPPPSSSSAPVIWEEETGKGRPHHPGEGLEAQTTPAPTSRSVTFEPNWARHWSIHRGTAEHNPAEIHPPSCVVFIWGDARSRADKRPSKDGEKKCRVGPDLRRNCKGRGAPCRHRCHRHTLLRSPAPATGAERRGLRCSAAGAAFAGGRAELLISLSSPDTIARQ